MRPIKRIIKSLRIYRYLLVKIGRIIKGKQTIDKPKNLPKEIETSLRIWSNLVHKKDSLLLYDPITRECYVEYEAKDQSIFLVLESGNMKIIDLLVCHDVSITLACESWCLEVFNREVHKRRRKFKKEYLDRIVHSLDNLENRI